MKLIQFVFLVASRMEFPMYDKENGRYDNKKLNQF